MNSTSCDKGYWPLQCQHGQARYHIENLEYRNRLHRGIKCLRSKVPQDLGPEKAMNSGRKLVGGGAQHNKACPVVLDKPAHPSSLLERSGNSSFGCLYRPMSFLSKSYFDFRWNIFRQLPHIGYSKFLSLAPVPPSIRPMIKICPSFWPALTTVSLTQIKTCSPKHKATKAVQSERPYLAVCLFVCGFEVGTGPLGETQK